MVKYLNYIISYSFYLIFLLVPLVFTSDNSELFELTKMWLTWGLTTIIVSAWITKATITKNYKITRTPFDIPLILFLVSQIISTIVSLDQRISLWGYYSRFNGGLLSTIAYIALYYAFVTNLTSKHVKNVIYISIFSAILVSIWGFPSHFGYDPTCYVVRKTLDISCWTEQFVPTVRTFSTLGQPAWLAAYLGVLIPVLFSIYLGLTKNTKSDNKGLFESLKNIIFSKPGSISIIILLYTLLNFANTRAGYIAFIIGLVVFFAGYFLLTKPNNFLKNSAIIIAVLILCNFLFGIPLNQLRFLSIGYKIQESLMKKAPSQIQPEQSPQTTQNNSQQSSSEEPSVANISDSGNIRKNVWRGAVNAWKASPIFGTGVETYAFAYYKHKPIEQNLTSEWDYLYNKAHNEYLNYAATTGTFGLGTYLLFIGWFLVMYTKWFISEGKKIMQSEKSPDSAKHMVLLSLGLTTGLVTILVSNFFGFSVVIINLYLFLIPVFIFILQKGIRAQISDQKPVQKTYASVNQTLVIGVSSITWLACLYILFLLYQFWVADKAYALGYNFNRIGRYDQAYPKLLEAVSKRKTEPVFLDELAYTNAVLATSYAAQKDEANTQKFTQDAIMLSDSVIQNNPNNIVYLKNRVRTLYELSKIDPRYLGIAMQTILKAYESAPNDAKIAYNAGVLLGQTGQITQGIDVLERAKRLRPDFRDVYFALGLFYREQATNNSASVKNPEMQKMAEENMMYILEKLNPNDELAKESLSSWGKIK